MGYLLFKKRLSIDRIIIIESLHALDHLTFAGENRMGTLQYRPSIELEQEALEVNLDQLNNNNISEIFSGESSTVIDNMFSKGGIAGVYRIQGRNIVLIKLDKYGVFNYKNTVNSNLKLLSTSNII